MEEIALISRQEPGVAVIDNFLEIKQALEQQLLVYKHMTYSKDGVATAKKDRAMLNKLKKAIDDKRKEIKKIYMQPYTVVEAQAKELIALIDEPLALIGDFIAQEETEQKQFRRKEIAAYYSQHSHVLGELADRIFEHSAFYDPKWENKSTLPSTYQAAISDKIRAVAVDISTIQATGGKYVAVLLQKYLESLSTEGLSAYKASLVAAESVTEISAPVIDEDSVTGYKVLRISGTMAQMLQAIEYMDLLGMEVDELEDGMPKGMEELHRPSFDSFVAFDIETTGTFGVAHGDTPPEITEIGAVKVINGVITDRFSMLANPGRRIVPRIARLTNISDEMLSKEPPVDDVIKCFKDFVGDNILVGHNIKNCDIPYISKAAKRAGIVFNNSYFDTYRYAKTLRTVMGWKNVKLEYLSEQFGISQLDAHRAWCDAEANAGIYLKLKELEVNP